MKKYKNNELKRILNRLSMDRDKLFTKEYIRTTSIVSELGEFFASKLLNLKLSKKDNPDYDGIDDNDQLVQVKTRGEHSRNLDPYIYRGFKGKLKFDYALFVLLDEKYWVKYIWKLTKKQVIKLRTKSGTINLSSGIKKQAEKVYP